MEKIETKLIFIKNMIILLSRWRRVALYIVGLYKFAVCSDDGTILIIDEYFKRSNIGRVLSSRCKI